MATALPEELMEEIFLRVPPHEPASLVRAALVCKTWRRILISADDSGEGFQRRYRRFHKTPPLLGYIHNAGLFKSGPRFVPTTTSFSPQQAPATPAPAKARDPNGSSIIISAWALDCRHGRVLIHTRADDDRESALVVWDPVTGGGQERVSMPDAYADYHPPHRCSWAAAVLCAVDGCDHIDCGSSSSRPFIVVFVEERAAAGADGAVQQEAATCTCASVYSSQTGAWSAVPASHTIVTDKLYNIEWRLPSLLIIGGDASSLYFTLRSYLNKILRYDLGTRRLSLVDTPPGVFEPVPVETVDGELGFVAFSACLSCVYMWSRRRQAAANNIGGAAAAAWERHRIVELDALIPSPLHQRPCVRPNEYPDDAIRFAEGTNTIFISMYIRDDKGVFALDLKSRQLSKIGETWVYPILPYMSFVLP